MCEGVTFHFWNMLNFSERLNYNNYNHFVNYSYPLIHVIDTEEKLVGSGCGFTNV